MPSSEEIDSTVSRGYWASLPPTVDSMLGGYPQISRTDLRGSATFLAKLRRLHGLTIKEGQSVKLDGGSESESATALDCGAGIGRVTAGFLAHHFTMIDCIEPIESFALQIKHQVFPSSPDIVRNIYITGLAEWALNKSSSLQGRYDMIWIQWCLIYLRDAELENFLRACIPSLKSHHGAAAASWIVVKENTTKETQTDQEVFDDEDSSVTRSEARYEQIFATVGLQVVMKERQRGFPANLGLFPVWMWALKPTVTGT